MKKQTYYVKVGSGELVTDPTVTEWEYEIKANDEEAAILKDLFDRASIQNMDIVYRVTHPIMGGKTNHDLHHYDDTLQEIYRMIYHLGDEKVKDHIESMNIINEYR